MMGAVWGCMGVHGGKGGCTRGCQATRGRSWRQRQQPAPAECTAQSRTHCSPCVHACVRTCSSAASGSTTRVPSCPYAQQTHAAVAWVARFTRPWVGGCVAVRMCSAHTAWLQARGRGALSSPRLGLPPANHYARCGMCIVPHARNLLLSPNMLAMGRPASASAAHAAFAAAASSEPSACSTCSTSVTAVRGCSAVSSTRSNRQRSSSSASCCSGPAGQQQGQGVVCMMGAVATPQNARRLSMRLTAPLVSFKCHHRAARCNRRQRRLLCE